jgi:hypothetical protein
MDVVCPCCGVSIDVEDKIYRENKQQEDDTTKR